MGAFLLCLVLAGLYRLLLSRAVARERAGWEGRLSATVRNRQVTLERWLRDLQAVAATVATYPTAVWLLEDAPSGPAPFPREEGAAAHLRSLLGAAARVHGLRSAWVIDAEGRVAAAAGGVGPPGAGVSLADSARRAGRTLLGLSGQPDGAALLVAAPVRRPGTDQVLGAVLLEEDPTDFLYPLLGTEPVPTQSGEAVLVEHREGGVVALSPTRKADVAFVPLRPGAFPPAPPADAAVRFVEHPADYAADAAWVASRELAGVPWALHAKVDQREGLALARREARLQLLALAGALLALLGLAFGAWRQQRARHDTAVAAERARFAALLMHANDPIFVVSEDGLIREASHRAVELYERPHEWFLGRPAEELRPAELRGGVAGQLEQLSRRGHLVTETVHLSASGRRIPVEISARRVELQGEVILLSIVRDLTERREAAQALRESEERYRAIVENTPDVVCRLDRSARFLFVSPSGLRAAGSKPGELEGRSVDALGYDPVESAKLKLAVAAVFDRGQPQELTLEQGTARSRRHFHWRLFPEYDAQSRIAAVVSVAQDVTEGRRLEEQLQQAQKMEAIGRLAGGVAHDFNNILTAIHGYAALARADVEQGQPLAAELDEIMSAADRAATLTRQLLAFSRRQILQPRRIDLVATVQAMAPMLRRLIGEHIESRYELPQEPLHVLADPGQLEQVLLNLAVNARDAMEHGGRLTVQLADEWRARDDGNPSRFAVLRVSDTGPGMHPDVLEHAFEPFFTTKEPGRGTGLGLATVYGVVQQSGGTIDVESAPAQGTTFTIRFPVASGDAPAQVKVEKPEPAPARASRTVLLAEDDASVRRLTERLLRRHGYHVLTATDGMDALRIARADTVVDLLLTDVVMPHLGGIALARQLRAERSGLPVVFMTGYTHDFTEQAAGIDPELLIVHKPYDARTLISMIERALARSEGRN